MSISTFNKLLQNQGCVWFVSAVTLAGVIGGALYQGCAADAGHRQVDQTEQQSDVIAKVGDVTITEAVVNARAAQILQGQFGGAIDIEKLPPELRSQAVGPGLEAAVTNGQLAYLAKKQGLRPNDEDVIRLAKQTLQAQAEEKRQRLIMTGELKATSTQQEFDAAVKKKEGKSVTEQLQEAEKDLRDGLKDAKRRENIIANIYYPGAMMEIAKKKISVTDDELKKGFSTYNFKRIYFAPGAHGTTLTPMDEAKKAFDEIKGGLSFEKAIDKYSSDRPDPKKKLSEILRPMTYSDMNRIPAYKPILALKPGQVGEPIQMGPGAAIYKLIDIKEDVPKDFDKNKAAYREKYISGQAESAVQQQLEQPIPIEWVNNAYRVMYESGKLRSQPVDDATRSKKTLELIQMAEDATNDKNPQTGRLASSLALGLFKELYSSSTPEQKKNLLPKGIEVYSLFFRNDEDPMGRTELADFYIQQGKGPEAASQLNAGALANQFNSDDRGQSVYNAINAKMKILQDKKMITADEAKNIQTLQQSFAKNKQEEDARIAKEKKEQEAAAKASTPPKGPLAPPKTTGGAPSGATKPADKPAKPKGK